MSVTNETFVGLQEWGIEVRKACLDKSVNLHTVSEAIGHSYSAITWMYRENYTRHISTERCGTKGPGKSQ